MKFLGMAAAAPLVARFTPHNPEKRTDWSMSPAAVAAGHVKYPPNVYVGSAEILDAELKHPTLLADGDIVTIGNDPLFYRIRYVTTFEDSK